MTLCKHPSCHLMREHTPNECGWPTEKERMSAPPAGRILEESRMYTTEMLDSQQLSPGYYPDMRDEIARIMLKLRRMAPDRTTFTVHVRLLP